MSLPRPLRYAAPNIVTSIGACFGLLSIVASFEGRYVDAAWLIIWSVLIDRVDGLVARTLRATSSFGVQMDSFADAINFGVAPAVLAFVVLDGLPQLGFADGSGRVLLLAALAAWVLANVFRLAKFNVASEEDAPGMFFGVATTLAAGTLTSWMLVLLKYAPPGSPLHEPGAFSGPKLYGDFTIPLSAWGYIPAAMIVYALLMASNLPMPKLGKASSPARTAFVLLITLSGYLCGMLRWMPDYMAPLPTLWTLAFLVWGQISPRTRALRPPAFLPRED